MRRFVLAVLLVLSSFVSGAALAPTAHAATVGLSDPQTGRITNEDPANFTPHILNGTVYSVVQVGDYIVVGGTFTSVRTAASSTAITRNRVFAFNATTGAISNAFNPGPNGTVYKVQQTPDPDYVYVAGNFTSAAGGSRRNLFKINVNTGAVDSSFTAPTLSGAVRDLDVVGNHLFVAGKFTHIGGRAQKALGTLNATTGAYDSYFTNVLAGLHRTGFDYDVTDVLQLSSNPQNTELTAVGNFTSVNGAARSQIAKFDLGQASATLSPWSTNLFTQTCSGKFDTYMTDVEYSPNGQYFVVSTTGAYGGSGSNSGTSGCDVVARFEAGTNTTATPATWTAYTGGDTTWNVEVTDNVIYAGGHQRWQNNPTRGDAAGQGAVERTGIAALNPLNGMPWSWNPTRTRGVGIQDMLATDQGLWVGSDTDRIGNYEYHGRIALLPLAGGKVLPPEVNVSLPGTVYSVPTGSSTLNQRAFDGTTPGAVSSGPSGGPSWGSAVGAFMVNGVLYTATSNGQLSKQTFNGSTFGSSSPVNAADALVTQTDWHNTDVPSLTSLFFYNGRMYFTRSGQSVLYRRGFEPESDVVGQQRFSSAAVSGINYANVRGAFVANNKFYYATTTGALFRADWAGNSPVAGTATQISGPGVDSQTWNSRALFVYQSSGQQQNQPPIPDAEVTCTGLDCSFDSTGSSDPGGSIASVLWQFGDGDTSTDPVTSHTYLTAGPRTVTLTVTDNEGASSQTTRSINPQQPVDPPPTAVANVSCNLLDCSYNTTGSSDPGGSIVSYLWDFGDGNTSTNATTTHSYAAAGPRTVTLTVTDNAGQTDTDTKNISPSDTASPVTFVGVTETNGNRTNHTVTVPAGTQVGDALVLFFAGNTTTPTYTYPAGWTAVGGGVLNGSGIVGRAFTKVATAAELGSTVRVTTSSYAKSDMALAVYRGTDGTNPVVASAGALDNTTTTAHTSPTVNAPAGSKWLVTYWSDKSSGTTAWTPPASQTFRSSRFGSPSGAMSGLLVDSNGDVSGATGGLTATANSSTNRALSFSIVLQ